MAVCPGMLARLDGPGGAYQTPCATLLA
jgi:hypothetical protein